MKNNRNFVDWGKFQSERKASHEITLMENCHTFVCWMWGFMVVLVARFQSAKGCSTHTSVTQFLGDWRWRWIRGFVGNSVFIRER